MSYNTGQAGWRCRVVDGNENGENRGSFHFKILFKNEI